MPWPVMQGTCARDDGQFNIRTSTGAARTLPLSSVLHDENSHVSCELTGDVDAHPVSYRFRDYVDQGDGLDFTAQDLGFPIFNRPHPLTGTAIPEWGWGHRDFTVSTWFKGSLWSETSTPYESGVCGAVSAALVPCGEHCVLREHCGTAGDACSMLLPRGQLVSCGDKCVPRGNCRLPPPVRTPFNRTVNVDFAKGVQNPDIDYVYLFSKAMVGMTFPGPTVVLHENDVIKFRMNADDDETWALSTACDGCLSQGNWALLTFVRLCPAERSRALDALCPVDDLLKVYVNGVLLAEKSVAPFRVMNDANVRWAAHHIFEEGQNLHGWMDDMRFYDFALTDVGVMNLLNSTSSLDCFDVVPPLRGSWGTCGADGYLPHQQVSCAERAIASALSVGALVR